MKLVSVYGDPLRTGGWDHEDPCGCCGMTYTGNTKVKVQANAGLGIRVIFGKHNEEKVVKHKAKPETDWDEAKPARETVVKHVETKQGILTVITRNVV